MTYLIDDPVPIMVFSISKVDTGRDEKQMIYFAWPYMVSGIHVYSNTVVSWVYNITSIKTIE